MKKPSVWLFRPIPHGANQLPYFLDKGRIALGYPIGQNLHDLTADELRQELQKHPGWESGFKNLIRLRDTMKVGDIVIVPDDNLRDVYFAQITSDYLYVKELDEDRAGTGFPHQRSVRWFLDKNPLLRSDLPQSLTESLRYPGTMADLTKHLATVAALLGLDLEIEGLAKDDADPSWGELTTLAQEVVERALRSDDPSVALRAAEIVLSRGSRQ